MSQGEIDARRKAAVALRSSDVDLQQQLLPVFVDLLMSEKDGQIRLAVLDIVADMGPAAAAAVPALAHAMRHDFGGRGNEERHQEFRAALALGKIGEPAVAELRNLLKDERENLRAEAVMALGRIGAAAAPAIEDILRLLSDSSERVRRDASRALGGMGDEAFAPLLAAADNVSATLRAAALDALAALKPKSSQIELALVVVKKRLEDESSEVRAAALRAVAICELPADALQAIYFKSLQDRDSVVRVAVVNALAQRPEMIQRMETQLGQLMLVDDDGVAWHATFLLQLRGVEATPILLAALTDQRSRIEQIARALFLLGHPLVKPLQDALDDPSSRVQQAAALALGQIRPLTDDTVAKLAAGLTSENRDAQGAFLTAIHSLGSQATPAIPAVRQLSGDERPEIRMQLIDILFEAAPRDKQLLDELIALVQDSDPRVQEHAIQALRASGPFGRPAIAVATAQLRSADTAVRAAAAKLIASHGRAAEEAVPPLVDLLEVGDAAWRVVLIETLGELGSAAQSALPAFNKLSTDPSPEIRSATLQALTNLQLSPQQIQPQLVQALHDSESDVRAQALSSIRRFGRRGMLFLPDLIALAAHEQDGESVRRSLERFESYPVEAACIPRLIELVQHDNLQVRRLAIRFLGLAGPAAENALPQLQPLTLHADEGLREEAATAVKKIQAE